MSKICKHCQNVLENSERFCPKCGHQEFEKYHESNEPIEEVNKELEKEEVPEKAVEEKVITKEEPQKEQIGTKEIPVKKYYKKSKTLGIISLILSIFTSIVAIIPAIFGIVFSKKAKRNKEKYKVGLITSIMAIIISIITGLLFYYVYENYINKENKPVERINYKAILKEYGKGFEKEVEKYLKENMVLPTFEEIESKYEFPEHKIICQDKIINQDGTIFLNVCTIDDKKVDYSYGKYIEIEEKNSNIVYFYHIFTSSCDYYTSSKMDKSLFQSTYGYGDEVELVNSYTCIDENCEGQEYSDKFIVIDNNDIYMANIGSSQKTFKKATANKEYVLDVENTRYIISEYRTSGKLFMYTIDNQEDINILFGYDEQDSYTYYDGDDKKTVVLSFDEVTLNDGVVLVANEVDYIQKNAYIYNFKTKKELLNVTTDNSYMNLTGDDNYYYLNCDFTGKRIFNHKFEEVLGKNHFLSDNLTSVFSDGTIITADFKYNEENQSEEYLNTYSKYDKNAQKTYTSEQYKRILSIHDKYALVIGQDNIIRLLNITNDSVEAQFGNWEETYSFRYISYTDYETGHDDALHFIVEDSSLHSSSSKTAGYVFTYKYSNGSFNKYKIDLDNY